MTTTTTTTRASGARLAARPAAKQQRRAARAAPSSPRSRGSSASRSKPEEKKTRTWPCASAPSRTSSATSSPCSRSAMASPYRRRWRTCARRLRRRPRTSPRPRRKQRGQATSSTDAPSSSASSSSSAATTSFPPDVDALALLLRSGTLAGEDKLRAWRALRRASLARAVAAPWALSALALRTRVALNVLGRHLFLAAHVPPPPAPPSPALRSNRNSSSVPSAEAASTLAVSKAAQERFLEWGHALPRRGAARLQRVASRAADSAFARFDLALGGAPRGGAEGSVRGARGGGGGAADDRGELRGAGGRRGQRGGREGPAPAPPPPKAPRQPKTPSRCGATSCSRRPRRQTGSSPRRPLPQQQLLPPGRQKPSLLRSLLQTALSSRRTGSRRASWPTTRSSGGWPRSSLRRCARLASPPRPPLLPGAPQGQPPRPCRMRCALLLLLLTRQSSSSSAAAGSGGGAASSSSFSLPFARVVPRAAAVGGALFDPDSAPCADALRRVAASPEVMELCAAVYSGML